MPFYNIQRTPETSTLPALAPRLDLIALERDIVDVGEPYDEPRVNESDPPAYDVVIPSSQLFQPQSIVIDRCLIFPAEPPSNALYQLNHDLDLGNSVALERIDHMTTEAPGRLPRIRVQDKPIYTFAHRIFNDKYIEITGKRKGCFAFVLMSRVTSLTGNVWKLSASDSSWKERGSMMLHCKPEKSLFGKPAVAFKWTDAGGKTVATESRPVRSLGSRNYDGEARAGPDARQVLKVLEPLEQKAIDMLVTAWCARVWHDNLQANKVLLTPNEGALSLTSQ